MSQDHPIIMCEECGDSPAVARYSVTDLGGDTYVAAAICYDCGFGRIFSGLSSREQSTLLSLQSQLAERKEVTS